MRRFFAFCILAIALVLPFRLRVWFAAGLGWTAQGIYWIYFSLMRVIVNSLKPKGDAQ